MSRPRIRTLKPEIWYRLATRSRDARHLFVVLITLADDEGRFLAAPASILGHGYPLDEDAPKRLHGWLDELVKHGFVARYEVDGVPYGALLGWSEHQKINRPSPSKLPPPPAAVRESAASVTNGSGNPHRILTERSVTDHAASTDRSLSHARGRGSDPIPSCSPSSASLPSSSSAIADANADATSGAADGAGDAERQRASSDVRRLCALLADLIADHDAKFNRSKATSVRWLRDMRLLVENDREGDVAEVERVLRWAQADDFWQANIMSPGKLREKFTQLLVKAGPTSPPRGRADDDFIARYNSTAPGRS